MSAPSRPLILALSALALVGLGIAAYLTTTHYSNVPLACSTTGLIDCAQVTRSSFSMIPGTDAPITIPGMAFFLVSGALALLTWNRQPVLLLGLHVLLGLAGIAAALYLVYAEVVVIHRICEWCTAVHVCILLTFLIAFRRWQQAAAEAE